MTAGERAVGLGEPTDLVVITPALRSSSSAISAEEWMVLAQMGRESVLGELLERSSLSAAQTLRCLARLEELGVIERRAADGAPESTFSATAREVVPASLLDRAPNVRRVVSDDSNDQADAVPSPAPMAEFPRANDQELGSTLHFGALSASDLETLRGAAHRNDASSNQTGRTGTQPTSEGGERSTLHFGSLAPEELEALRKAALAAADGSHAAIAHEDGERRTLHFGSLTPNELEALRGAAVKKETSSEVGEARLAPPEGEGSTLHDGARSTPELNALRDAATSHPIGDESHGRSAAHLGAFGDSRLTSPSATWIGGAEVELRASSDPSSRGGASALLHRDGDEPADANDPSSWDWDQVSRSATGGTSSAPPSAEASEALSLRDLAAGGASTLHFAGAAAEGRLPPADIADLRAATLHFAGLPVAGPPSREESAARHLAGMPGHAPAPVADTPASSTLHFAGTATPIPALGAGGPDAWGEHTTEAAPWDATAEGRAALAGTLLTGEARPLLMRVEAEGPAPAFNVTLSASELGSDAFASIATPTGYTPAPPLLGPEGESDQLPRTSFAEAILRERLTELDRELADGPGLTPPPSVSERAQRAPPPIDASPGVAHPLGADAIPEELRVELETLESHAQRQDLFALFGIARDADPATIKRAFHTLSRRLHPDRFVHLGRGEARARLERLFRRICDAHATLGDPARRRAWAEAHPSLARPFSSSATPPPPRAPDAELRDSERRSRLAQHPYMRRQVGVRELVERARVQLESGAHTEAIENLARARLEAPDEPEISSLMARARDAHSTQLSREQETLGATAEARGFPGPALDAYRRAATINPRNGPVALKAAKLLTRQGGDLREARLFAQRAVDLLPDDVDALLLLAQVLIRSGARKLARKPLEEVLRIEPKHPTARSQLLQLRFGL